MTRFSEMQVRRYSRQILLADIGGRGQARLLAAGVAIDVDDIAGRIAAVLLAAAGVGRVALGGALDRRLDDADVGFPLTLDDRGLSLGEAMAAHLAGRNPDVKVVEAGADEVRWLRLAADPTGEPPSVARAFERAGAAVSALVHALAAGHAR